MPNQNNTWDWFRNDKLNLTIISDKVNQVITKNKTKRGCRDKSLWSTLCMYASCEKCAKKVIFTACNLGKVKLAFTSPKVISTSPPKVFDEQK